MNANNNLAAIERLKPAASQRRATTPGAASMARTRDRHRLLFRIADWLLCETGRLSEADDRNVEAIEHALEQLLIDHVVDVETNGTPKRAVPYSCERAPGLLFRKPRKG